VKQFFDKLKEDRKKRLNQEKPYFYVKLEELRKKGGGPAKEAAGSSEKASTFGLRAVSGQVFTA